MIPQHRASNTDVQMQSDSPAIKPLPVLNSALMLSSIPTLPPMSLMNRSAISDESFSSPPAILMDSSSSPPSLSSSSSSSPSDDAFVAVHNIQPDRSTQQSNKPVDFQGLDDRASLHLGLAQSMTTAAAEQQESYTSKQSRDDAAARDDAHARDRRDDADEKKSEDDLSGAASSSSSQRGSSSADRSDRARNPPSLRVASVPVKNEPQSDDEDEPMGESSVKRESEAERYVTRRNKSRREIVGVKMPMDEFTIR